MALLTRDAILKADDLPKETVDVPEWGGGVLVRSMTGAERDAFEAQMFEGGKARLQNLRARLVSQVCVDEQGNRLFTDEDIVALGAKSANALDRVFNAAQRLNAMGKEDVEAAKKG